MPDPKNITAYKLPFLWGLLHAINDGLAGYMLASFTFSHNGKEGMLMLVIYAILGFGGQLPVGIWLDKSSSFYNFSKVSLILLVLSPVSWLMNPYLGIIIAGFSSAFVHVTGGAICLKTSNNNVGPLGVFTAPGVLGLALGSASSSLSSYWLLVPMVCTIIIACFLLRRDSSAIFQCSSSTKPLLDNHDMIMFGILLTVTLRSLVYDIIQQVSQHWQYGLLIIGISAFIGKIIGGFIADRIGWKTFVYITLPLALILLQFGHENLYMLGLGIACLQSSVPISLLLMYRSIPLYPGMASALVLGTAIILAGLPMYNIDLQYMINGWFGKIGWGASIVIIIMIVFKLKKWRFW